MKKQARGHQTHAPGPRRHQRGAIPKRGVGRTRGRAASRGSAVMVHVMKGQLGFFIMFFSRGCFCRISVRLHDYNLGSHDHTSLLFCSSRSASALSSQQALYFPLFSFQKRTMVSLGEKMRSGGLSSHHSSPTPAYTKYTTISREQGYRVLGVVGGGHKGQTPTKNVSPQFCKAPCQYSESAPVIPVCTKGSLRLVRFYLEYTNRKKNGRQLGFKWWWFLLS